MADFQLERRDDFVVVNDTRLAVTEWGGAGDTIFFSHPTGFFGKIWYPTIRCLREKGFDGRIVTYDQRGQGMSAKPDSGYEWSKLIEDSTELVETLGIREALGVGHSAGGTTIGCIAARTRGVLRRAVLIDPILVGSINRGEAYDPKKDGMALRARTRRTVFDSRTQFFDYFRDRPPYASWTEEALRVYAEFGLFDRPDGHVELLCPARVESALYAGAHELDPIAEFENVDIPVLLCGCDESDSFRATHRKLAKAALSNHRWYEYENATHFAPMMYPELTADLILAELSG